jgi:hypothetical protein
MGLKSNVDQMFVTLVESGNVRYVTQPAAAVGTACVSDAAAAAWAWAAYVQICAAAVIANPSWLVGILVSTGVVEISDGDIAIASGGAGAEVDLAIFPVSWTHVPTAVGIGVAMPCMLPYPIRIAGSPRLACRVRKATAASASGVSLKVILATAIGT